MADINYLLSKLGYSRDVYQYLDPVLKNYNFSIQTTTSSAIRQNNFTTKNPSPSDILLFIGTIPCNFQGKNYSIPLRICFVYKNFPIYPPMIILNPTLDMEIQTSPIVSQDGSIITLDLQNWINGQNQGLKYSLVKILQTLQQIFGQNPPLRQKRSDKNLSSQFSLTNLKKISNQASKQAQLAATQFVNSNNLNTTHFNKFSKNFSKMATTKFENLQTNVKTNVNYHLGQVKFGESMTSLKRTNYQIEANKILCQKGVEEKIKLDNEILKLQEAFYNFSSHQNQINLQIDTVNATNDKLNKMILQLESELEKLTRLKNWSEKETKLDVDSLIYPKTPVDKQLLSSFCKDQSISEILIVLSKKMTNHEINVEDYLKETRKLGRMAFYEKAVIKKVLEII